MTNPNKLKHLIQSTTILMVAFFINKVLAVGRQIIIAPAFGTGSEYDAFVAAFRLPDILYMLISGGALATALIPVLSERLTTHPDQDPLGWRLVSYVVNTMLLVALTVSLVVVILADWLVAYIIAPGFDLPGQQLTAEMMRLILISTIIFSLSGLIGAVLHTRQHFVWPALAPILYNLGIIAGAVFLVPSWGVYGLVWGTIAGAAGHLVIQLPGLFYYAWQDVTSPKIPTDQQSTVSFWRLYVPRLGWGDPGLWEVVGLMGPRIVTMFVIQLNFVVMFNLASRLGQGSVSALDYGWDLMQMPQTIIGTAIGIVLFPTMSELAAQRDLPRLWETTVYAMRIMLTLALPAMIGLIVLGRPVIQLMFERGEFGPDSTAAVYQSLQFWAIALVAHCIMEVVNRFFYAQKDTTTPLISSTLSMFLNLGLAVLLYRRLDAGGLALSNGLAVSLEILFLLAIAYRQVRPVSLAPLGNTLGRSLLAALVMGLAVGLFTFIISTQLPAVSPLILVSGGGLLGLLVYPLAGWLLGVDEIRWLPRLARQRFGG